MLFDEGVSHGIRRLSEVCFGSGIALMLVVLLLDNTVFLLNFYVQSLGFYLQNLVKLGFHTDAFEQLGSSFSARDWGRIEGGNTDGPSDWMQSWTVDTFDCCFRKKVTPVFLGILLGLMACPVSLSWDVYCTNLTRSNCETVPDGHHGCTCLLLLPLDHHLWRSWSADGTRGSWSKPLLPQPLV